MAAEMVAQSEESPRAYRAGDAIKANLTLKPGHDPFALVSVQLSLAPPPTTWDPNRPSSFGLSGIPSTPSPTADEVLAVSGVVPHQIHGGTYRVTAVTFMIVNGPMKTQTIADGAGFAVAIADDPPLPHDDPVAINVELIGQPASMGTGIVEGSHVRDSQTKQAGIV